MHYTKEALHKTEVNVSEVLESYDIPDPYIWRFNEKGQLVPQFSNTPVEDIVLRNNPIAKIEYDAFLNIQERAFKMHSGYIIWISPIDSIYYPDASKIIISEKREDTIQNRAIKTNWDVVGSILAAQELATLSDLDPNIFKSANDVRANPIFIGKDKEYYLNLVIRKILTQSIINMIEKGEDFKFKKQFMDDLLARRSVPLGPSPQSCPPMMRNRLTAFQVFIGEDEFGSLQFECPHCRKINIRCPHVLLEKCLHCKENVKCN